MPSHPPPSPPAKRRPRPTSPARRQSARSSQESGAVDFDAITEPLAARVTAGLVRIAQAIRSNAWRNGERDDLTPTQAQILSLLADAGSDGMRPAAIAERMQVTAPTISDALGALARKGLVTRTTAASDRRGTVVRLTADGTRAAAAVSDWPEFLRRAVGALPQPHQILLFRGLMGTIRELQRRGDIPVSRMCVTCRYFRPNVHADPERPHHCAFVDAPFGDRHLRLDCPDQSPVPPGDAAAVWARFIDPASST
ncbi:MAG TPA: MarR family winged helix-turn-helix transcriptional regulator [Alphaproteobacteria bacterium]